MAIKVLAIGDFAGPMGQVARHPQVKMVVLAEPGSCRLFEEDGVFEAVRPFEMPRSKVDLSAAYRIRRVIRETRPDVVHVLGSRNLAAAMMATTWMRSAPRVVSFHGISSRLSRWDPGNHLSYLHPRIAGFACKSDAVREGLRQSGVDAGKLVTTYNWFSLGKHERVGRRGLEPFGVSREAFVVGTVSTIRPVKGLDLLLEAAKKCADLKDLMIVMIGPCQDPLVEKLTDDPAIRDRVRLVGYRADAVSLISGADVYAMPSRSEGLGLALLQAMEQGVCPLVSDAGGMKEIVRHGVDGLVVPREDVAALEVAIRRLHGDRALVRKFAESAEGRVRDFLDPERFRQRMFALYQQVLDLARS